MASHRNCLLSRKKRKKFRKTKNKKNKTKKNLNPVKSILRACNINKCNNKINL